MGSFKMLPLALVQKILAYTEDLGLVLYLQGELPTMRAGLEKRCPRKLVKSRIANERGDEVQEKNISERWNILLE